MMNQLKQSFHKTHHLLKTDWKKFYLYYTFILLVLVILIQFTYPSNRLVLFTTIDGVMYSGWNKNDVISQLDNKYSDQTISVYFGSLEQPYLTLRPSDIGVNISNEARVNNIDYPWYLRIIPTSILWAHIFNQTANQPTYQRDGNVLDGYVNKKLGDNCDVAAQDASLALANNNLVVQPSKIGIVCNINDVKNYLSTIKLSLGSLAITRITATETTPFITDDIATKLLAKIKNAVGDGVLLKSEDSSLVIPAATLYSWLDFSSSGNQITYNLNESRASGYLFKEYISLLSSDYQSIISSNTTEASVTKVNIVNSRLNVGLTLTNIKAVVDGDISQADIVVVVPDTIVVDSLDNVKDNADFASVLSRYAQSHQGTYGVTLIELSNPSRRADYNGSRTFTTASTYKLFVAYSALLRVESGAWHWSDQIVDDRDLSTCFDDMIINSDNDCGSALLEKVGYQNLTKEAVAAGCVNTSFLGNDGIKTTANDLAMLLAKLQTGQILTLQSSRDLLINAMKNNAYRDGIPTGISGSVVADKVGFMDNLLHDASIIYSPSGNYILVIMTEDSSWQTIADFAGQIEAYHAG